MRVRFKTISAGPKGALFPGDLLDVSESEAKVLVERGYAEYLTPPPAPEPPAEQPAEESEEIQPAPRRPRARRTE